MLRAQVLHFGAVKVMAHYMDVDSMSTAIVSDQGRTVRMLHICRQMTRPSAADDAEWMSGKSRARRALTLTKASSWMSDQSRVRASEELPQGGDRRGLGTRALPLRSIPPQQSNGRMKCPTKVDPKRAPANYGFGPNSASVGSQPHLPSIATPALCVAARRTTARSLVPAQPARHVRWPQLGQRCGDRCTTDPFVQRHRPNLEPQTLLTVPAACASGR
jgi:hypothetical protein